MSNLTERFFKSVGRHFVTLSCVQRLPGATSEKVFVFSGFLVDVAGAWLYVTAGHILRDVRMALKQGATFDVWRLGDHTAGNRFKGVAIPFAFDIDKWLVIEDEQRGLDYAAVALNTMYCLLLEAGGAVPIAKMAWGDYLTEHDHWALVGIPSETVSYDGETVISARVVVAPLEPTDRPEIAGSKAENQFYARLKEDSVGTVNNIDGMSGGPIFALKKVEGEWKYSVIGVQSGWYRDIRTVTACPFSSFGLAVADAVESGLREASSPPGVVPGAI